ncbi:hypothetical protein ABW21_db0201713 [Orbilia brochopaga]|nr:hypothetical protein ABW21_db0201713 [Drechslerella brochopaga]
MRVSIFSTVLRASLLASSLLALGVPATVVWSDVDHFDVILRSKDAAIWANLVKDIRALHELWLIDKPTLRIQGFKPNGQTLETFDDFAEIALPIIEDIRILFEPIDDDTVGLELALKIVQHPRFGGIENAHHAVSILDTLTGYFINLPSWIEGIISATGNIDNFGSNPLSVVFWLFGASLASSPSGKPRIVWDTTRPGFIRKLFLHLKLELQWAADEFETRAPMIEALTPDHSVEIESVFNSMVLWTGHYAQVVQRVLDDLNAIQGTKSFEAVYGTAGSPKANMKKILQQFKRPWNAPEQQFTLTEELQELREAEALRTEPAAAGIETNDESP